MCSAAAELEAAECSTAASKILLGNKAIISQESGTVLSEPMNREYERVVTEICDVQPCLSGGDNISRLKSFLSWSELKAGGDLKGKS